MMVPSQDDRGDNHIASQVVVDTGAPGARPAGEPGLVKV